MKTEVFLCEELTDVSYIIEKNCSLQDGLYSKLGRLISRELVLDKLLKYVGHFKILHTLRFLFKKWIYFTKYTYRPSM